MQDINSTPAFGSFIETSQLSTIRLLQQRPSVHSKQKVQKDLPPPDVFFKHLSRLGILL